MTEPLLTRALAPTRSKIACSKLLERETFSISQITNMYPFVCTVGLCNMYSMVPNWRAGTAIYFEKKYPPAQPN